MATLPNGEQELSRDELATIARELVERFVDTSRGEFEVKAERMVNLGHVPLVHAFSTHALRLGAAALVLTERDLHLEAAPTIRAAYECALTACWLADSKEAPAAVFNEHVRQRTNLANAMTSANSPLFRQGGRSLPHIDDEKLASAANAQARWFEKLCESLHPGGADAYVIYRAMSAFAHPSADLADEYVQENPEHPSGMRLLTAPIVDDDSRWLPFMLVASMIWAARALDVMVIGTPQRNYLRGLAHRVGVAEVLRLSQEALSAEQRADRDRRRAAWKGPRKRTEQQPRDPS